MKETNKFSPEVGERAVRLAHDHRGEYPSLWAAVESIAPKFGCGPQTLLDWVKQAEVDSGARPGVSTAEAQRIRELEREVKELRWANRASTATCVRSRRGLGRERRWLLSVRRRICWCGPWLDDRFERSARVDRAECLLIIRSGPSSHPCRRR